MGEKLEDLKEKVNGIQFAVKDIEDRWEEFILDNELRVMEKQEFDFWYA